MTEFMSDIIAVGDFMIFKRVKHLRQDNDFTQQHVANLLHISRSTYSAYENGANALPITTLINIAKIYNTSTDYILELTDNPSPYRLK